MARYHRHIAFKNIYSLILYVASVPLAFVDVRLSFFIFVFVALSYFLPERKLAEPENNALMTERHASRTLWIA